MKHRHLIIITYDYENSYTGGIRRTNLFADYALKNYSPTKLIDFAKLPSWVRKIRLATVIYFCNFYLKLRNCHTVVDHVFHLRLLLPLLLSRRLGNNYSVLFFQKFYHLRINPFTKFVEYLTEKLLLKKASQIIVASHSARNDVKEFGIQKEKIQIVTPTVLLKGNGVVKTECHNNLLFIGQVEPWKGLDILIGALSLIKDIPFYLDVVGRYNPNSKYFRQTQKLIIQYELEPKIIFHGQKTGARLMDIFRKADLFVFPSRYEAFGIVLLEAMSFGLPIVATGIPSTKEIVKDYENGIICPPEDPVGLADALRTVLTNPNLRKNLAQANLARAKTFLAKEEISAKVFSIIKPFLS